MHRLSNSSCYTDVYYNVHHLDFFFFFLLTCKNIPISCPSVIDANTVQSPDRYYHAAGLYTASGNLDSSLFPAWGMSEGM